MNIQEYCDTLGIEIDLKYYPNQGGRWCASFDRCEFKDRADSGILSTAHGNGKTPDDAISEFV